VATMCLCVDGFHEAPAVYGYSYICMLVSGLIISFMSC
jgi:hypothetical protein